MPVETLIATGSEKIQSPPIPEQVLAELSKPTEHRKAIPFTKSPLKHIRRIVAEDGFVKVHTDDGHVHMKQAEELFALAANCEEMMYAIRVAEEKGRNVPPAVKSQTQQLILDITEAARAAKYQQETALRMDHKTRAVQAVTDNLAWQAGGLQKERGPFDSSRLPEESNIQWYKARFPLLKEGEIASMLRLTQYPEEFRVGILRTLHGKRLKESGVEDAAGIQKLLKDRPRG